MAERPILFSGPMVRAILAGTKTQTRRVLKPQRVHGWDPAPPTPGAIPKGRWSWRFGDTHQRVYQDCPFGVPGDRLWVRETWNVRGLCWSMPIQASKAAAPDAFVYAADDPKGWSGGWRPSIHMPRWASRITLEITDVRVERLTSISEEDARAEGCVHRTYRDGRGDESARLDFRRLWDSINGNRPSCSWADGPWVWVVSFRRVEVAHG